MNRCAAAITLLLAGILWRVAPSPAADPFNLEPGLPVRVTDAEPVARGSRQFQVASAYESTDDDDNRYVVEPRLVYGFAPGWQGRLAVPIVMGTDDKTGSGDIVLEALVQLLREASVRPSLSLAGQIDLPTGRNTEGLDATLRGFASKTLSERRRDRVHLNLSMRHNASDRPHHRERLYTGGIGYSRMVREGTLLAADVITRQELDRTHDSNILELGFRQALDAVHVVSFGVGAGMYADSPQITASLGVQKAF